jgi:hypothetical protein
MQIRRALAAAALALVAGPALALEPPVYDQAFVDAFAEACVPGRLAYETTYAVALAAGWALVERDDHAELAAVMQKSDEALAAEDDMEMDFVGALFARDVAGARHHLSVTQSTFVIEEGDDPWVMVGCHLYNFDATQPIDPTFVTAFVGKPIANSVEQDGLTGHVWGPPCPMPRTADTYLSFVADGSSTAQAVGFSGLSMNFSTSTPDPGEEVPETYC